jgi:hypothetical protein
MINHEPQLLERAERAGTVLSPALVRLSAGGRRCVGADASDFVLATEQPARPAPSSGYLRASARVGVGAAASVFDRAMPKEALSDRGPDDVLLLYRGYRRLVLVLNKRGIRFVMRCDNGSGWPTVRELVRSACTEVTVRLKPPSARDAHDWGCSRVVPSAHLVCHVAPDGAIRVLATNLPADEVPPAGGEPYYRRWRVEEDFKRFKSTGFTSRRFWLSQHALIIDVAAKVFANNIASLLCATAQAEHRSDEPTRRCNRNYTARCMRHLQPAILLLADLIEMIAVTLAQLADNTRRRSSDRCRPRPTHYVKLHA